MVFVYDSKQKRTLPFLHGMPKDKKDVVFVKFSYNGMKTNIVLVVTISLGQDHFVGLE
ncbi:conserved protein of unknown function [Candidatus Nitrosocosmicus franklandus]|uniref:Uncharacterized protein n=1 Tax=Candidatus Nitrosocosmicus franklandianus TaxID=1798806 RepID=A0A484IAS2_9ARCH|nr:conserved protein of unknown function [Candidatus Nitrosocosmicus franklandus]